MTPEERIALAERAHAEGRIIQGSWRRKAGGRELVCALAAFGPDINGLSDCPADLMPFWLAELVPTLDDGIAADDVLWFSGELIKRARAWQKLDAPAWERVRVAFLSACITQALEGAEKAQPTPRPAYWDQVQDACGRVLRALKGDGDLAAARAAARAAAEDAATWAAATTWAAAAAAAGAAAWAATWAAEAAEAAAWAAAWAAAEAAGAAGAAAWAEAAAGAAGAAAWAAAATWAAEEAEAAAAAATYKLLCVSLFAALDAEIQP